MEIRNILLTEIDHAKSKIRLSQNDEKLQELVESIKSEGVLSPVKVRQSKSGYVLIYGHRRVDAAKLAGLKEIPAILEQIDDNALLTQALTENVIREDMAALDIAKALQTIIDETGCTQDALAKKLGHDRTWVYGYLDMLEPLLGLTKGRPGDVDAKHVKEAKAGTHGDLKLAGMVLKKAADEGLSTRQTRFVADEINRAHKQYGERGTKAVLARSYEDIIGKTTDELEPIAGVKSQSSKLKTLDWRTSLSVVDSALLTLEKTVKQLVTEEKGKFVIRQSVPKYIKTLKRIIAELEAI